MPLLPAASSFLAQQRASKTEGISEVFLILVVL
jgi:hypothetical protein